jgi:hypothetical protein
MLTLSIRTLDSCLQELRADDRQSPTITLSQSWTCHNCGVVLAEHKRGAHTCQEIPLTRMHCAHCDGRNVRASAPRCDECWHHAKNSGDWSQATVWCCDGCKSKFWDAHHLHNWLECKHNATPRVCFHPNPNLSCKTLTFLHSF